MQLTIHRGHFGVTPDGEWHQKIEGVGWVPIPQPEWSKKKRTPAKVAKLDELRMKPKEGHKVRMIKVYKVTEKTVPDYEAEVLCRNGWQDYYPGTLRHNNESAAVSG